MKITEENTLREIIADFGLEEKSWIINPEEIIPGKETEAPDLSALMPEPFRGKKMADLKLRELKCVFDAWNVPSMVDGLNALERRVREGGYFHEIWSDEEKALDPGKARTGLFSFPVKGSGRFLLICPGGGYTNVCSIAEGFPVAAACNQMGISAFILHYRTAAYAHCPNPQDDLAQALRVILGNQEKFGLTGTRYAVCGFSAGGHLAASFGTEKRGYSAYGLPKPEAMILGYPVVTMGKFTHEGSRNELLKEQAGSPDACREWSVEELVTPAYPPTFLWNCREDNCVPCENSTSLKAALDGAGVLSVYESFPGEDHGWGLGVGTAAEGWLERAIDFWKKAGGEQD